MRRGGRRSGGPTRSERGRGTGRGSSRTSGSTSRSCGGPARRGAGRGESPEEALRRAFEEVEATRIGTTSFDFPALLPLAERRKHLYVVGKTGSGKTTLLSHLLAEDLEAGRGVGVIAPEAELFRDVVLPMVPEHRQTRSSTSRRVDPRTRSPSTRSPSRKGRSGRGRPRSSSPSSSGRWGRRSSEPGWVRSSGTRSPASQGEQARRSST